MSRHIKSSFAALASIAIFTAAASGQSDSPEQRLAAAAQLDCTFSALATGDWTDKGPAIDATPVDVEASFSDIDVGEGTAESGGRFGDSFIVVRYAEGRLHLIQSFLAGPLYVTTVFARETAGGRLAAVQVRHEYTATRLPGFTSRPELYVGDCEATG
jgi:hypothetical protein